MADTAAVAGKNLGEGKTVFVQLAQLKPGLNARKHIDEGKQKELETSIKQVGIVQHLIVRDVSEEGVPMKMYEIVAGERRYKAARAVKYEPVPVSVRALTDEEAVQVGLIDNNDREDVHPMDEAEYYGQLIRKFKYDVRKIAGLLKNRSVQYVANRLQLLKLTEKAKTALWENKIDLGQALVICQVDEKYQKDLLGRATDRWNPDNAKMLQEYVSKNMMVKLSNAPWKWEDADLVPAAGACTKCPKRTSANPDLFGDGGRNDRCLDGACFALKAAAFAKQRREELERQGKKVFDVTEGYRGTEGLRVTQYERSSKKDADGYGVAVAGPNKGEIFPIKFSREYKAELKKKEVQRKPVKKSAAATAKDEKEKAERQLERLQEQANEFALLEAAKQVVKKIKGDWPLEGLRMVVGDSIIGTDRLPENLEAYLNKEAKSATLNHGMVNVNGRHGIENLTRQQLLVYGLGQRILYEASSGDDEGVIAVAKQYGIDVKKIEKARLTELKAGLNPEKKKEGAKKKEGSEGEKK